MTVHIIMQGGLLRSPERIPADAEVWTVEEDGRACWRVLSLVPQLFTAERPYTYSATLAQGLKAPKLPEVEAPSNDLGELPVKTWDTQLREIVETAA